VIQTIVSVAPRQRTTLRGEVVRVHAFERPWVRTDVVLSDGTANLVLRFVGRRSVPGFCPGRQVLVEGTVGPVGHDLVMLNPLYSFDGVG